MLAVVHAVVREEEKGPSCMTVWDVFHVLSFFRVRSEYKKAIKKTLNPAYRLPETVQKPEGDMVLFY